MSGGCFISADGKSIFQHSDPQKLVNEFAGKGMKLNKVSSGTPGYRELVNFGEPIGYAVDEKTGEAVATTWGKIHYAKDGVHIVPAKPRL
ncbi:MAG: polymorphic toxin type 50 domain-containing protein [Chlamydiota bacterium]